MRTENWPLPLRQPRNAIVRFPRTVSRIKAAFLPAIASESRTIAAVSPESYFEVELVNRLQTVVEKQRNQIKKLEQANIEYKSDNEEVCHHKAIIYTK